MGRMALVHTGDALEVLQTLPDESVHCCVTSPPYWGLRDYGVDGQLGLEKTPQEYVGRMVDVFREVRRVLRDDGTLWLNMGDSYNGSQQTGGLNSISGHGASQPHGGILKQAPGLKPKDLVGIPWMLAFALRADGWYLRRDIIWSKPNPMPESVTDRPTSAHEYVFLMSKNARYYYDADAIREPASDSTINRWGVSAVRVSDPSSSHPVPGESTCGINPNGRNKRSVWTITTKPYKEAHFATFPPDLVKPMIRAGCPPAGTVLDPFAGSGTTGAVAKELGRESVLIELNPEYVTLIEKRLGDTMPALVAT